jgi:UDP-2-acetamido-3-amino-2,3-dideoxy-glucuronate N-acetyltransferase
MKFFAHSSSYIDPGAEIGPDTKIWHFCHVMPDTKIGKECNIGQNVFIASGVTVGNRVKIQNNVSIYQGVILENDVFLGPSMVFTNVINPRSHVIRREEYQKTLVKQGVSIGANATIVCGITLGKYAFVGAGSVVTRDVLPYSLVYGNPARHQGWICQCGIQLHFERDTAICEVCGLNYQKNQNKVSLHGE